MNLTIKEEKKDMSGNPDTASAHGTSSGYDYSRTRLDWWKRVYAEDWFRVTPMSALSYLSAILRKPIPASLLATKEQLREFKMINKEFKSRWLQQLSHGKTLVMLTGLTQPKYERLPRGEMTPSSIRRFCILRGKCPGILLERPDLFPVTPETLQNPSLSRYHGVSEAEIQLLSANPDLMAMFVDYMNGGEEWDLSFQERRWKPRQFMPAILGHMLEEKLESNGTIKKHRWIPIDMFFPRSYIAVREELPNLKMCMLWGHLVKFSQRIANEELNIWETAAGRVKRGQNYVAAACDELREETGIVLDPTNYHNQMAQIGFTEPRIRTIAGVQQPTTTAIFLVRAGKEQKQQQREGVGNCHTSQAPDVPSALAER